MKKKTYMYLALAGIVGILLAVFMVYCHYNHVSREPLGDGIMKLLPMFENSATVTIFKWCCIVAVAYFMIVPACSLSEFKTPVVVKNNFAMIFACSLLGFLFAGYVVNFFVAPFRNLWSSVSFLQADLSSADVMLKLIYYVGVAVSVPCAVYFLILAIRNVFAPNAKIAILSVFPVIWLSLRLVYYFMSTSAHVNLAGRRINIIAMCFAVVFFLQDAKCWLPENKEDTEPKARKKHSKIYYASGFGAIVTLAISHFAGTYLQAFWLINPEDSYLLNGIYITMILYIVFRIASVTSGNENRKTSNSVDN